MERDGKRGDDGRGEKKKDGKWKKREKGGDESSTKEEEDMKETFRERDSEKIEQSSVLHKSKELPTPTYVKSWKLEKLIGEGFSGSVYEATNTESGKKVVELVFDPSGVPLYHSLFFRWL